MGNERTYADFYRGLGLGITIFLLAESVVCWLLASLAMTDAKRLRPILITLLMAYLTLSVNSYAYFFMGPAIAELLIVACIGMAIQSAARVSSRGTGQVTSGLSSAV